MLGQGQIASLDFVNQPKTLLWVGKRRQPQSSVLDFPPLFSALKLILSDLCDSRPLFLEHELVSLNTIITYWNRHKDFKSFRLQIH